MSRVVSTRWCCVLAVLASASVHAGEPDVHSIPMAFETRFDPAHIQGGERLGLLSTSLLFEVDPGWWIGPMAMGAAGGHRGGFFVLGAQAQRRWQLADQWRAQLSLTAGGGGGGGAPVGGGLLVQPAASLLYDWGPVQTGVTWSRVNMPSGQIGSQQWGLVLNWDGRMRYFDIGALGKTSSDTGRTGLGFDRVVLSTTQLHVKARADVPASTVRLLGARADQRIGEYGYWGIEAAAATHGGADGYMEVLGTAGLETAQLDSLHLGVRGALGLGGGGAVQTGGGVLAKAAATARWDIGRDAFLGLEAGVARSGSGDYRARYAQVQLGLQLDHPGSADAAHVEGMAWSGGLQHMSHAARKDGSSLGLDTMGLKVRRDVGEQFYLTGQAQSAFAGRAGAFSLGLAGVGWASSVASHSWNLSAELLAGAAGGGGVDTRGGSVAQGMAYLGYALDGGRQLQLGVGRIRSQHGGLSSPVIDLSWTQQLGIGAR